MRARVPRDVVGRRIVVRAEGRGPAALVSELVDAATDTLETTNGAVGSTESTLLGLVIALVALAAAPRRRNDGAVVTNAT